jgi:xyloglucan-specific exo-beta-1,4-glucanase
MRKLAFVLFSVLLQTSPQAEEAIPYTWENVRIGGGGYLLGVVVHPRDPGVIYVRADVGGCYRWDESSGRLVQLMNWVPAEQSNLYGVAGLALDPTDPRTVYIAAGKYPDRTPSDVFRSRDQGASWEPMGLDKPFPGNKNPHRQGNRLAVNPHRPGELWCGTFGEGLWKHDGQGWSLVADVPPGVDVQTVVFDPKDAAMIYVAVHGEGVFRSADGGRSFTRVGEAPKKLSDLSLSPDGTILYASAWEEGVHRLAQAATGVEWENISPEEAKFRTVTASPHDPGVVMTAKGEYGSLSHFHISTDGGTTWTQRKDREARQSIPWHGGGYPGSAISQIAFDPVDPKRVYFTDWYAFWKTDDWTASPVVWDNAMTAGHEEVVNVVLGSAHPENPAGAILYSGHADVNGFTHLDLVNYPSVNISLSGVEKMQEVTGFDFAESDPAFVVALGGIGWNTHEGLLATSADGGVTWQAQAGFNIEWGAGRVAVSATDPRRLVAATQAGGVVFSEDRGVNWAASEAAPPASDLGLGGVFNYRQILCSDRLNGDFYLYARKTGQVWRSSDGGRTFVPTAKLSTRRMPPSSTCAARPPIPDTSGSLAGVTCSAASTAG